MKSAMSAQPIPLRAKVRSAVDLLRSYARGEMRSAAPELRYHERLLGLFDQYVGTPVEGARLLEIGCGQLAPQLALFTSLGARITAIDVERPTFHLGPSDALRIVRENGAERALKSIVRHALFDHRAMRDLERLAERRLRYDDLDFRLMDATHLEFADDEFDFAFSRATFEHIADVRAAARELNRVLRPGGAAYISTHLFPSPSGGHHLEWIDPNRKSSERVPAWDHLREHRFPVNTYLNRLRIADYRKIFAEELSIVDEFTTKEGEHLLTDALRDELFAKGYTEEDLTSRNLVVVLRKRP